MADRKQPAVVPAFPNRLAAFQAIGVAGFKVSSSKFYRDCSTPGKNDGLVLVNPDGSIDEARIREYCKTLKRIEGDISDLSDSQELKARMEVEKLQEQVQKLRFEREKEEGKWVPRDEVDLKIMSVVTTFDIRFRQLLDMNLAQVCRLVGGNQKKVNDAKDFMEGQLDTMLDRLAAADSFTLEFEEF